MITLDRDAPLQIADQIVEGLRFEIGAGRYRPGERLPSTRAFGEQLGVSFHTVRKAYQGLAGEGVLEVRRGGGYFVAERTALTRAERLERGAGVVRDALHRLVGLGLSEDEVQYVVEEGVQFFERPGRARVLLFAAAYRELAESGAEQASGALQERVVPVLLGELAAQAGVEGVVAPMPLLAAARRAQPDAEAVGVVVQVAQAVLEAVAGLGPGETLGLATRLADAVEPLTADLRVRTGFAGAVVAVPAEADRRAVEARLREASLVLYTPGARRRIRPLLGGVRGFELAPVLSPDSLARVRERLAV